MIHETVISALQEAAKNKEPYRGYPVERLTVEAISESNGLVEIPEGPWEHNNTNLPSAQETAAFIDAGYAVDSLGRPLHPAFNAMVTNPEVSVITGKGAYWNWGPNFTADPIVITQTKQPRILLIQRGDTGKWALPGGFVDTGETNPELSARRELKEEANFDAPPEATLVYAGVVGDVRTTAHAWPETSAYLYQVDRHSPIQAGDDAKDARWFRLHDIDNLLFGSHNFLISEARKQITTIETNTLQDILNKPMEALTVTVVSEGHMAYDHLLVSDNTATLFIKQHVPEQFTDSEREAHSRAYLHKENDICEYVAQRGFSHLPDRVELIDNNTLAMDALTVREGWMFTVPEDQDSRTQYINDILKALSELQLIPLDTKASYRHEIPSTFETLWREGWDTMSDDQLSAVREKARSLSRSWLPEQQQAVERLLGSLENLRTSSFAIQKPHENDLYMTHHDMRPSNIAWHPKHGVRIVDWSWADPGYKNSDATTFLIDLKKAGHDIRPYIDQFNKDHALLMIGFWLGHILWQTRDESSTVRQQQLASACAALELLEPSR